MNFLRVCNVSSSAVDGQNIFIHSLNARCIIEEYGSLNQGPQELTGQIIDFECFTMTKVRLFQIDYIKITKVSGTEISKQPIDL